MLLHPAPVGLAHVMPVSILLVALGDAPVGVIRLMTMDARYRKSDPMKKSGTTASEVFNIRYILFRLLGEISDVATGITKKNGMISRNSLFLNYISYSHSIVPGGLEEMSYTTRFTPRTSLMMREEASASKSGGSLAQSAVIPS